MKTGNKKIFVRDKAKLSQMLAMRYDGFGLTTLAILFNVDPMSIVYNCRKFHIEPQNEPIVLERILKQIIPQPNEIRRNMIYW